MKVVLIFNFMLLNETNKDVLYYLPTAPGYVQGAIRKKQMIASFVEHLKEKP